MPAPSTSIEQLLADLHAEDFLTRCDAARELGKTRDPRAVESLLGDLNDPDWRVRRNAAQALGACKSKTAVDPLIHALNDRTMTVRCRAAVALGRIKDPRAIPALLQAIPGGSDQVAQAASDALKKFGKMALPAIAGALPGADTHTKANLLHLLCAIPGAAALPEISEALKDANPVVRMQAARILGRSGTAPSQAAALLASLEDPDLFVRAEIIRTLGQHPDPALLPHLLAQLVDHELFGERRDLYQAVAGCVQRMAGFSGEYSNIASNNPIALTSLLDGDPIGSVGSHDPGISSLLEMMNRAMHAFGKFYSPEETADMLPSHLRGGYNLTQDFRNAPRNAANQIDSLLDMLSDGRPTVRAAAALTLPWYGNQRALEPLQMAALDSDAQVRIAAAWAVESLRTFLEYKGQLGY